MTPERAKSEQQDIAASLDRAASALARGDLAVFPTETVYGLGADATNDEAVAGIFAAKDRPDFNPLIVHVADLEMAQQFGTFDETSLKLAKAFWPSALSLVVPRADKCPASYLVSAGLETIALRVPANDVAQKLLRAFGGAIAAPSANLSGRLSPTRAEHIDPQIAKAVAEVVDGGACSVGLESTIVAAQESSVFLLRPGGVSVEALEEVIGTIRRGILDPKAPTSPGQLISHYAPGAPVRLNAEDVRDGEALLKFGNSVIGNADRALATKSLSTTGDLKEAAANLFQMLRDLDANHPSAIAVAPIPKEGLGLAINDRLTRAAAPRETQNS